MIIEQNELTLNKTNCTTLATLGLIATTLPLGQALADQFEEAKPRQLASLAWTGCQRRLHHSQDLPSNGAQPTTSQWKVPVEGNGSSTPIIWGNKLFILTAINTGQVEPGHCPNLRINPSACLRYHSSQLLHMNLS